MSIDSCAHRGQLRRGHLEPAVADHPPRLVGLGLARLGADGGGQRKAHRAQAARRDQAARQVVMVVLRLPHLMLADVGDDERAALGDARQRSLSTCAAYRWPLSGSEGDRSRCHAPPSPTSSASIRAIQDHSRESDASTRGIS
jgi:hypothetical protein